MQSVGMLEVANQWEWMCVSTSQSEVPISRVLFAALYWQSQPSEWDDWESVPDCMNGKIPIYGKESLIATMVRAWQQARLDSLFN